MKILIACDKFKGSLNALDVCTSIKQGIENAASQMDCNILPMADGGDGTLEVLEYALDLERIYVDTINPLGEEMITYFLSNGKDAFIELSKASGIALIANAAYNPAELNTIGTGVLIEKAITMGHSHITIALGGSCTNDVGLGILSALGYVFTDQNGNAVKPVGSSLNQIQDFSGPSINDTTFHIITDVINPLYGPNGAAHVFAAQKGASKMMINELDQGMQHFAKVILSTKGVEVNAIEGGGAAGGIAAGLYGLLDASIESGFKFLSKIVALEKAIKESDVVVSGEGKLDASSFGGKVVGGVIKLCEKYDKPLVLCVGQIDENIEISAVIKSIYTISDKAINKADAIENASFYLRELGKDFREDFPEVLPEV
ncbi:MAG: glycerate kinase [Bacteroidota bacterium]